MPVTLTSLPRSEVVLDADRAGGIGDRREGRWCERCAPEIRLQHHAGRVHHATERAPITFAESTARRFGGGRLIERRARGACLREHIAHCAHEALAREIDAAGG